MARKKSSTERVLTAEEVAAIPAGAKYRCINCGHWTKSVAESHAHKDESPACDNRVTITR